MDRFECREQISAGEYAVEVLPTIGIELIGFGVMIYDGNVVHMCKRGKVFEGFHQKLGVRLVDFRPDCQGL